MRRVMSICVVLAALVLAVYWPVSHFTFLEYDDTAMVRENPQVQAGLTWASVGYAFTRALVGNWHPVTTLSHILDCQVFGVNAGPMHLVNTSFHAVNALLLFLVLGRLTGAIWRSAIVAAFFALHPLRVESVAWISERKDVLSAFFFLLTLWAYVCYAQGMGKNAKVRIRNAESRFTPHASRSTFHASPFYLLSLLFFALGLMSKPMVVTLPFVLLLLDFWPLGRLQLSTFTPQLAPKPAPPGRPQLSTVNYQPSTFTALLWEKVPFFVLAVAASVTTFLIQERAGATALMARVTFGERVANAITSYLCYLGKTCWPTRLAAIYPHPALRFFPSEQWPDWEILAGALLLLAISVLCFCQLRRRPYLAFGWFWFLGTLVPVIGLIQVGEQAMADRYTYLPLIGPIISLVWIAAEAVDPALSLSDGKGATEERTRQAAVPTPLLPPHKAGRGRGSRKDNGGSIRRGLPCPVGKIALTGLTVLALAACAALTRRQLQYWQNTVALFDHTIEVTAANPSAHLSLGTGLEKEGDVRRAAVEYRIATAISPAYAEAHYNLGHLLREQGAKQEATLEYLAAVRLKPKDLKFQLNLAGVLLESGQTRDAVGCFEEALRIEPDSTEALNNLAWVLAVNGDPAIRNGARAVEYGERACRLTEYKQTIMVGTLAAAYAEAGRFADAVATAEKACALATQNGERALLEKNRQLLELYRAGKPYREPAAR